MSFSTTYQRYFARLVGNAKHLSQCTKHPNYRESKKYVKNTRKSGFEFNFEENGWLRRKTVSIDLLFMFFFRLCLNGNAIKVVFLAVRLLRINKVKWLGKMLHYGARWRGWGQVMCVQSIYSVPSPFQLYTAIKLFLKASTAVGCSFV